MILWKWVWFSTVLLHTEKIYLDFYRSKVTAVLPMWSGGLTDEITTVYNCYYMERN